MPILPFDWTLSLIHMSILVIEIPLFNSSLNLIRVKWICLLEIESTKGTTFGVLEFCFDPIQRQKPSGLKYIKQWEDWIIQMIKVESIVFCSIRILQTYHFDGWVSIGVMLLMGSMRKEYLKEVVIVIGPHFLLMVKFISFMVHQENVR